MFIFKCTYEVMKEFGSEQLLKLNLLLRWNPGGWSHVEDVDVLITGEDLIRVPAGPEHRLISSNTGDIDFLLNSIMAVEFLLALCWARGLGGGRRCRRLRLRAGRHPGTLHAQPWSVFLSIGEGSGDTGADWQQPPSSKPARSLPGKLNNIKHLVKIYLYL